MILFAKLFGYLREDFESIYLGSSCLLLAINFIKPPKQGFLADEILTKQKKIATKQKKT
jgi:hypothetical protein